MQLPIKPSTIRKPPSLLSKQKGRARIFRNDSNAMILKFFYCFFVTVARVLNEGSRRCGRNRTRIGFEQLD